MQSIKNKKRRCLWVVMLLGCALLFTGCSETELEERNFPMLAAVGFEDNKVTFVAAFPKAVTGQEDSAGKEITISTAEADDFEQSIKKYESHSNKQLDYNHLKVFVIEKDLIEEQTAYKQMLDYLAENERFPRNTYVCVVDDIEDLFELEKNISQDLGTYLEEYINKHEERKSHILTLGDILDEKENQSLILYMPYLEIEDDYMEWKGYYSNLGQYQSLR